MPRYTDDSRERVRDAVDFVELVGARTELKPAGPRRTTTAGAPFWRKALMRKLPVPGIDTAVFSSISSSYSLIWRSVRIS